MFAFDRDPQRVKILQTMVDRSGATCIKVQCRDFLKVDPNDPLYAGVEYILVDPSCSGSGNVDNGDVQWRYVYVRVYPSSCHFQIF